IQRMLDAVGIPVIASGGVASINDIKRLMPLQSKGLEGVILGKALYTGALCLSDAICTACQE
ncbi:MAG TPA: HisA/HisF-related TIM barrel protein, partial [Armatimonadota bacterium]|nr:HisA/HisF-related TIM barrel protein [Armatimonadota bacterium]